MVGGMPMTVQPQADAAGASYGQQIREIAQTVVVLVRLAGMDGVQTSPGIAAATGIPEPTVAKVLKTLAAGDLVVLFTSTPGFKNDVRLAEEMKTAKPSLKIAFVGPHVTVEPAKSLDTSTAIDWVGRKEFDYSVYEFAHGMDLARIDGVSYRDASGAIAKKCLTTGQSARVAGRRGKASSTAAMDVRRSLRSICSGETFYRRQRFAGNAQDSRDPSARAERMVGAIRLADRRC